MRLSRLVLLPVLIVGALPCVAQSASALQPSTPAMRFAAPQSFPSISMSPASPQTQIPVWRSKNSLPAGGGLCLSIRDYEFATPPGSAVPLLKDYSTCESASRFHISEVTISPQQQHP